MLNISKDEKRYSEIELDLHKKLAYEKGRASIIEELEKIKEKVKQRKILPKTSARSDYEMGLIDGRSTEKVAIMGIIKKEIAELKGENNEIYN